MKICLRDRKISHLIFQSSKAIYFKYFSNSSYFPHRRYFFFLSFIFFNETFIFLLLQIALFLLFVLILTHFYRSPLFSYTVHTRVIYIFNNKKCSSSELLLNIFLLQNEMRFFIHTHARSVRSTTTSGYNF